MSIPEANTVFVSNVPLEIGPNMPGLALTVSATPSLLVLPAKPNGENLFMLYFDGLDALDVWFAIGDSTVQATLASTVVVAGIQQIFELSIEGQRCTHISLRTRAGTTLGTFNMFRRGQ